MELVSLLRFSFCDVYMTSGIYIAFWPIVYHKPRSFASEPFRAVCRGLHRELAHTVNSLADLIFERFSCCNLLFFFDFWCVRKVECWFVCIPIIMTSDFLLDLMFYRNFDRIVFFAKVVIETVFTLRWAEFLDIL